MKIIIEIKSKQILKKERLENKNETRVFTETIKNIKRLFVALILKV